MMEDKFEQMVNALVKGDVCPPRERKENSLCRSEENRFSTMSDLDKDPNEESQKECRQCWRNWFFKWGFTSSDISKKDEESRTPHASNH